MAVFHKRATGYYRNTFSWLHILHWVIFNLDIYLQLWNGVKDGASYRDSLLCHRKKAKFLQWQWNYAFCGVFVCCSFITYAHLEIRNRRSFGPACGNLFFSRLPPANIHWPKEVPHLIPEMTHQQETQNGQDVMQMECKWRYAKWPKSDKNNKEQNKIGSLKKVCKDIKIKSDP